MCGITGIWHLDNAALHKETLVKFTDSLQHRGPDGGGYFIDKKLPLGLGHRRLSILDLSTAGNQPMAFADERYWIAYNGEVFNFLEIREELLQKGYKFRSDTDTEVILAAYHLWGQACLPKFNGMWAMAIWDSQEQSLFLARDRFGIKPLYFLHIPNKIFAFASETIAFKYLDNFPRQWNDDNLALVMQNCFSLEGKGHTTFRNTYQLLGGHWLKITKNNPNFQQQRWWNTLENKQEVPQNYEAQVQKFYDLLQDSALLRLRSDVPIASALSGGVDSSAVYCVLNEIEKNSNLSKLRTPKDWRKAFVATFPNTILDEKQYAEEVISYTKGDANYLVPDYNNLVQDVLSTTKLFDSVILTPISIVTEIYKQMSKEGFKISMDGHGVDEMLLGYPDFSLTAYQYALQQGNQAAADAYWDTYTQLFLPEMQAGLTKPALAKANVPKPPPSMSVQLYQKFVPESAKNLYRNIKKNFGIAPNYASQKTHIIDDGSWVFNRNSPELAVLSNKIVDTSALNPVDNYLYGAFHLDILPTILRNFDRASMQSGIEIRMPFMDYRLVSYIFSLPLESKIGGGFTKKILRDAMANKMPDSIRNRKMKIGLNAPMIEWFSGEMAEFLLDEVHSQSFQNSTLWNGKLLQGFVQDKIKNKSWQWHEVCNFWSIMNAHILVNKS
jgi:asparagine synthase (glutamine-hydrolysing)